MGFVVTIEGLDTTARKIDKAFATLRRGVAKATLDAADAGVKAAQRNHPYQDHREPGKSHEEGGEIGLTDTAHFEQEGDNVAGEVISADMVWPAPYAGFVDKGTSRSRPYPFTPRADREATRVLKSGVQEALERMRRTVAR